MYLSPTGSEVGIRRFFSWYSPIYQWSSAPFRVSVSQGGMESSLECAHTFLVLLLCLQTKVKTCLWGFLGSSWHGLRCLRHCAFWHFPTSTVNSVFGLNPYPFPPSHCLGCYISPLETCRTIWSPSFSSNPRRHTYVCTHILRLPPRSRSGSFVLPNLCYCCCHSWSIFKLPHRL